MQGYGSHAGKNVCSNLELMRTLLVEPNVMSDQFEQDELKKMSK